MATCLELGVNQCIVYPDLETTSLGRDEGNAFDLRFKVIKQFIYQADSPVGKVSDSAVGNGYFQHGNRSLKSNTKIILLLH